MIYYIILSKIDIIIFILYFIFIMNSSCKIESNKREIISIEGNIGSGKTTLVNKLQESFNQNFVFLEEPLDEWLQIKDENENTILSKFYSDQCKYSFPFQMMAYISRLNKLKENIKQHDKHIFTERSLSTDKFVFAKMLYDNKLMDTCEYQIYNKWFDSFNQETAITKIIYVKTDPVICNERVNKRCREGENNISQDYLNKCHLYHEEMIKKQNIPILVLDGNDNVFDDNIINVWKNKISTFI